MRACLLLLGLMVGFGCAEGASISGGGGSDSAGAPGTGGQASGAGSQGGDTSTGAHAQGGEGPSGGAPIGGAPTGGASTGGQGQGGGGALEQSCPANQFATGFDAGGAIVCSTVDAQAKLAVNAGCDVFFGVSDNCGSCAGPPLKWGRVNGASCANGLGADNTCSSALLGGATVGLFGLNTDGDVDDNDKLFAAFSCDDGTPAPGPGPCAASELVVGVDGDTLTCDSLPASALDYVRDSCTLYLGWRDDCDGCTTAPAKWASATATTCSVGAGPGNTCAGTILGPDTVQLLGIDLDGDMDGNDKLYVGMHCLAGAPASGSAPTLCPAGQYVVGTNADGSVDCASAAPQLATYVAAHCSIYMGSRDNCDGCTTAPDKWGRARSGFCDSGSGADNTCSTATLGGQSVSLFGLNTDGDVNDDDKLYLGFVCD